jgi:probable phosphoglycerate mutase
MPRLLLVRHGESEWNAAGRWQGQADPPLTDTGRSQAMRAARAIGAVDAIVASDLQRARDTAEILAAAIGIGPVVIDPRLRERHAGEWSGLTRADIHAEWPGYLADDPLHREAESAPPGERRPPGWEPDEQLLERVLAALAELTTALPSGDALVVTHGGVIYAIEHALGATHERVPNLGARWLEVDGARLTLGERIALLDLGEPTGARVDRDAI